MSTQASTSSTPMASQSSTLALTDEVMRRFKPAKVFKSSVDNIPTPGLRQQNQGPKHITGISIDDTGTQLVTAGEDETFRLYSCKSGKSSKLFMSKKYGVDLPRFTHKSSNIIYASTKEDDTIRYHSLHDNKYLQYFRGHKGRVVSLEMSPLDDGFMSGSMDKTVRVWDLRSPQCRGQLVLPATPIVAYDPSGIIFAVAVNHYSRILLYDLSQYDKAPFLVITLEDPTLTKISYPPRPIFITSLSFSSNGKFILVGCSGDAHYVIDAYEGHLLAKLNGHVGLERRSVMTQKGIEPSKGCSGEEVSWTPDSKFVVSGSLDGRIVVWDLQDLQTRTGDIDLSIPPQVIKPFTSLDSHPEPSRCVKFNPKFAMMASAGPQLSFWLPDNNASPEDITKEIMTKRGLL